MDYRMIREERYKLQRDEYKVSIIDNQKNMINHFYHLIPGNSLINYIHIIINIFLIRSYIHGTHGFTIHITVPGKKVYQ